MSQQEKNLPLDTSAGPGGADPVVDDIADAQAAAPVTASITTMGVRGEEREGNVTLLRDLCATMVDGSLCAMGGMTPFPVLSPLDHFPEDFGIKPASKPAKAA